MSRTHCAYGQQISSQQQVNYKRAYRPGAGKYFINQTSINRLSGRQNNEQYKRGVNSHVCCCGTDRHTRAVLSWPDRTIPHYIQQWGGGGIFLCPVMILCKFHNNTTTEGHNRKGNPKGGFKNPMRIYQPEG